MMASRSHVLRIARRARNASIQAIGRRQLATETSAKPRGEGDISAAFASLSGMEFKPLEPRFAKVKMDLIAGRENALRDSWHRLLDALREEIPLIANQKSKVIPEVQYDQLDNAGEDFGAELKKRGVAVLRNVIPQEEALDMKASLRHYLKQNPQTKAFPAHDPQVYELYWSPSQIKARSHPRLLKAQKFLMQMWHSKDKNALVSTSHPAIYADRLRMRLPGDASFALGPHVDGGSCERWEPEGYGRGEVYKDIWNGRWEKFDPWESSCRLPVQSDLYQGIGACSMFRMFQGWLSLSDTGPFEGTLQVNPLLKHATAYFLLRPFFSPRVAEDATSSDDFLAPENWQLDLSPDNSWLHGATPGHGQELRPNLHPHLDLARSMVHVPRVSPGDYVVWHCDTIHAVDQVHQGSSDSSVMYIPTCPLTENNARFLTRQRENFLAGTPSPDFGGGVGESEHIGRPGPEDVAAVDAEEGMQAFGLKKWQVDMPEYSAGQKQVLRKANAILGFDE